jgi:co-chaperonin GroES (HSP10)
MKVNGKIIPLRNKVIVSDMEFGMEMTKHGIIIPSDNGKTTGIHPRWGKVYAVGPEQHDITIGEWICVEHGRWSRTIEFEQDNGEILELRVVDPNCILMSADERPEDSIQRMT